MIKFIREYEFYKENVFDIIYEKDGYVSKIVTVDESKMPKTAKAFLKTATPKKQYDTVFKREEIIYQ